jgi:hypothetical protein
MSPRLKPQFSWRGVLLIAIPFMLIGFAILFRSGGSQSAPVSGQSAPIDSKYALSIVGGSILFAVVALLGGYFGYLRAISRLRKNSEDDSVDASRNT